MLGVVPNPIDDLLCPKTGAEPKLKLGAAAVVGAAKEVLVPKILEVALERVETAVVVGVSDGTEAVGAFPNAKLLASVFMTEAVVCACVFKPKILAFGLAVCANVNVPAAVLALLAVVKRPAQPTETYQILALEDSPNMFNSWTQNNHAFNRRFRRDKHLFHTCRQGVPYLAWLLHQGCQS